MADDQPRRAPLRLEPPKRRVDPIALQAWREGRGGEPPKAPPEPPERRRARASGAIAGAVTVLVVLGIALVVALPGCIRRRAIAAAAERGVTLTVGHVSVGAGRFTLADIRASSTEVPSVSLRANEIEVEMAGLDAATVTVRNGEIDANGAYDAIVAELARWSAAHPPSKTAAKVVFESMRLGWSAPSRFVSRVDALELHVDQDPREGELHVQSPRVTLETSGGVLGPWRVSFDRDPKTVRARVGLDPALGDGPSVIVVADGERVTSAQLNVARTTLGAIGLHASTLGLSVASDATQLEANARYDWHAPGRADARATLTMYGLKLTRATPLDARIDVEGAGDPAAGIAVKKGEIALGPLKGAVTGSLRAEHGPRLELDAQAGPVPCAAFLTSTSAATGAGDAAQTSQKINEIAEEMKKLAQALGLAKVTGDYRAEASVVVDATDWSKSRVTFTPHSTCEATLFGE